MELVIVTPSPSVIKIPCVLFTPLHPKLSQTSLLILTFVEASNINNESLVLLQIIFYKTKSNFKC